MSRPKLAYTIPEAAATYGVTDKTIRAAINSGRLRAKRASRNDQGEGTGKYLIASDALAAWFEDLVDA